MLICGSSGAGKSALALELMAFGAELVSDDRTLLRQDGSDIIASAPDTICGLIEARGVGILRANPCPPTVVRLVVNMDTPETERLPECRRVTIAGCQLPLLHRVAQVHFGAAILQMLRCGRKNPE